MKVLLIEDDDYKARQIVEFVNTLGYEVEVKKAYNSGMMALTNNQYDLVLLDMTIPSFELSPEHPTSRIRKYGGRDILCEMERCEIVVPTIIITQYKVFDDGEKSLEILNKELEEEYSQIYKGLIYYNSSIVDWQEKLQNILSNI